MIIGDKLTKRALRRPARENARAVTLSAVITGSLAKPDDHHLRRARPSVALGMAARRVGRWAGGMEGRKKKKTYFSAA